MKKLILLLVAIGLCVIPIKLLYAQSQQYDVTITASVPDTTVTFAGDTSPYGFVTILDGVIAVGTTIADQNGVFSKTISAVTEGNHIFGVKAEDGDGIETSTVTFDLDIVSQTDTVISNILMPTTINLNKSSVVAGESFRVSGICTPNTTVDVYVQGQGKVGDDNANNAGNWNLDLNATYGVGAHSVYAIVRTGGGRTSEQSLQETLTIVAEPTPTPTTAPTATPTPVPTRVPTPQVTITPTPIPTATPTPPRSCRRSDLNCDGKVNLTDFSILLYHWGTSHKTGDINEDGRVNLTDFSIMLYDWTG